MIVFYYFVCVGILKSDAHFDYTVSLLNEIVFLPLAQQSK
jgi:hypothetical protein